MAMERYNIMINVTEAACRNGYQDVLRSLIAIPWVQSIERLDGIFDLMVQVENPVMMGYAAADELLAKGWVKHLQVLRIEAAEPAEPVEVMTPRVAELITRA